MPRIASAKKNMRKTKAATARNRSQRAALRTALKTAKSTESTPAAKKKATQLLTGPLARG